MTFQRQQPVTRNPAIRDIEITLKRTTDPDEPSQSVEFRIAIDDQFGRPMNHLHGDLIPHLTTPQKNQLIAFMDAMWTKAQEEVLP